MNIYKDVVFFTSEPDVDEPDGLSCGLQYKMFKVMNIYKDVVFFTSENSERVSGNQIANVCLR